MKIKKISAIILTGALLASAVGMNAFAADAKPTITVFGNEATPAKPNEIIELNIRLSDFGSVAGMDIALNGANSTFESITSSEIELVKDSNYTLTNNKIHIVELNSKENVNLKVKVKAAATADLTVDAKLAKDGTSLVENAKINNGKIVVGTASEKVENDTTVLVAEDGYFIPYGSVYNDNSTDFIKKDGDGKFTGVSTNTNYQKFALPTDITTFGVSSMFTASNGSTNRQFGTYANNYDDKDYGTMLILGDFNAAADYVREKSGMSVSELLNFISNSFDSKNIAKDGKKYLPVSYMKNGEKEQLKVIKVAQTKYLWKNTDGKACEYALRVINIKDPETYTAVGYHGSNLSTEIKTEIYTK